MRKSTHVNRTSAILTMITCPFSAMFLYRAIKKNDAQEYQKFTNVGSYWTMPLITSAAITGLMIGYGYALMAILRKCLDHDPNSSINKAYRRLSIEHDHTKIAVCIGIFAVCMLTFCIVGHCLSKRGCNDKPDANGENDKSQISDDKDQRERFERAKKQSNLMMKIMLWSVGITISIPIILTIIAVGVMAAGSCRGGCGSGGCGGSSSKPSTEMNAEVTTEVNPSFSIAW